MPFWHDFMTESAFGVRLAMVPLPKPEIFVNKIAKSVSSFSQIVWCICYEG